jgi:hypothetical protein
MARLFAEDEVRRMITRAVAEAIAPLKTRIAELETRGESSRRWCERIWTVRATCAQQGRSAVEFIHHSIIAHLTNQPYPSLLPLPP